MLQKVASNYRTRVASLAGERVDLHYADVRVLSPRVAHVLLGYSAATGTPPTVEVDRFIRAAFGGKVVPILESIRVHDKEGALHLLVAMDSPVVPLAEAKKRGFRQVNPLLFRSAASGETWNVLETETGPMLMRREADDISAIMAEREERRREGSNGRLLFATLRTASRVNPTPGDEFEFYWKGQVLDGTISSVSADRSVTIKAFDGGSYTVPHEALGRSKKVGPQALAEQESYVQKYFSQVFAADPSMAKDIATMTPAAPGQLPEPSVGEIPKDVPLPKTGSVAPDPRGIVQRLRGTSAGRL
jgi:hypothetical protein